MQSSLITCEHATNRIPREYTSIFHARRIVSGPWGRKRIGSLLHDHWGYDLGAFATARVLQRALRVPLYAFPYSRLLIEADSFGGSSLFSPIMMELPQSERDDLRLRYWVPYVQRIEHFIRTQHAKGRRVVHIASHSFTPVLNGMRRDCDIGILYDPKRRAEARFANQLHSALQQSLPRHRVRKNYPYTGASEGLVTYFRKRFPDHWYIGMEIEVNNRHIRRPTKRGAAIRTALVNAFCASIRHIDIEVN
jgi:predicted N-formylglutamate amidohydrolase